MLSHSPTTRRWWHFFFTAGRFNSQLHPDHAKGALEGVLRQDINALEHSLPIRSGTKGGEGLCSTCTKV